MNTRRTDKEMYLLYKRIKSLRSQGLLFKQIAHQLGLSLGSLSSLYYTVKKGLYWGRFDAVA